MIILLCIIGFLLLAALGFVLAGLVLSRRQFHCRFEGGGDYYPYFSVLHPDWEREAVSFPGTAGTLRGWLFSYPDTPSKGLIVFFHGYGMSHADYLPECEYFCRRGYRVLSFDGAGTGISDGMLMGLPQHILDLQACLRHVQSQTEFSALPLLLYGHSWGGYAADCIGALESFPIRGIVSATGFYGSLSALAPYTRRHYGPLAPLPLLGIRLYQRLHFRLYS